MHAKLVVESVVLHVLLSGLRHVLCMQTSTIRKFIGRVGLGYLNSCMTCNSTTSLKIHKAITGQQLSFFKYNLILMLKILKLYFGLYQADLHYDTEVTDSINPKKYLLVSFHCLVTKHGE